MRKINKGNEPESLQKWKKANPLGVYSELSAIERKDIRETNAAEQYFLCGYCCAAISGNSTDTMNEHVEAQKIAPNRTLDFSNIIASCRSPGNCDATHGSQPLPLTPFMPECEVELRYMLSGRVEGLSERAKETIRVLNLGDKESSNKALIEKRKSLCNALLWSNGIDPAEGLEDDDLIMSVIESLLQPHEQRLEPFAPVLANIMKNWLA
ncbi:hypothetical protein ACWYXK_20200 [Janthinobacterium lividum]